MIRAAPTGSLAISDLTLVEFADALARLTRMGVLAGDRHAVQHALQDHARHALARLELRPSTYALATEVLLAEPSLGLRAADALHLAVAAEHGETLCTLDRTLLSAAANLGVDATDAGVLGTPAVG